MSEQPKEPQREADDDGHPLRRVSLRTFESVIDQQVKAAEAAGQLSNLPGSGKPLQLNDDTHVPEEDRVGYRMLKNSGFAPPWVELRKSIQADQTELDTWLTQSNKRWAKLGELERSNLRTEYERRLRELNKSITNYNLTAPPVAGQIPLLQPWRELPKLGA